MALILQARKRNKNTYKIFMTAEYSGVEVKLAPNFEMGVSNKTPQYLKMNTSGKVLVLETQDGPIFGSHAIARYGGYMFNPLWMRWVDEFLPPVAWLKTDNALYGPSLNDYSQIEQWSDFSTLEIDANINAWYRPRMGQTPYHPHIEEAKISALKRALNTLLLIPTWLGNL